MESKCPKCGVSWVGDVGWLCGSSEYKGSFHQSVHCQIVERIAALTEENAKLKAEVATLESEVVRRDACIADMKSTPMPNEAVMTELQALAELQRRFAEHYDGHVRQIHLTVAGAFDEASAAIAALPAAGDERWEKTRSLHDLISVLFPLPESVDELVDAAQTMVREGVNFDNDEDEVESASHVVGWRDSLVAALRQSHELVSLSQPPQEAGDEPGK